MTKKRGAHPKGKEPRQSATVRLDPDLIQWMRDNKARGSQADLITIAMRNHYDIPEPK